MIIYFVPVLATILFLFVQAKRDFVKRKVRILDSYLALVLGWVFSLLFTFFVSSISFFNWFVGLIGVFLVFYLPYKFGRQSGSFGLGDLLVILGVQSLNFSWPFIGFSLVVYALAAVLLFVHVSWKHLDEKQAFIPYLLVSYIVLITLSTLISYGMGLF